MGSILDQVVFSNHSLIATFKPDEHWKSRLLKPARELRKDLLFDRGQNDEKPNSALVLRSETGSSTVTIENTRAIMNTNYYGDYTKPASWDKRHEYLLRKSDIILHLFDSAGLAIDFLALASIARISQQTVDVDLKKLAHKRFDLSKVLSGDLYDLSIRASRVEGNCFLNLHINWYETRELTVTAPISGGGMMVAIPLWDMVVADDGLEFRFDINNKHGLFQGKREWNMDDHLEVLLQSRTLFEEAYRTTVVQLLTQEPAS